MIIDNHVHIHGNGTVPEIIAYMEQFTKLYNIEHINLQSIPMVGEVKRLQNLKILMIKDMMYPYVFAGFGLYQGKGHKDYLTQLTEGLAQGFDSVKMLEAKPDTRKELGKPIYDESFDPFDSEIEEKGLYLLMHSGDPRNSWDRSKCSQWVIDHGRCYDGEGFLSAEEHYAEVERVLEKHPKLKIALAHFYFLDEDLPRAAEFLDKHPNAMFDLTPGGHYETFSKDPETAREFFIKYADRLIFGTDVNDTILTDTKGYHSRLYGMAIGMINGDPIPDFREGGYRSLNLPDEVANKILYENSKKLLGENPKPVNRDAVIREISEIEKEIASLSEYEKAAFAEIKAYFMGR